MKTITGIIVFPIFCILLSFFVLITDPAFTLLLMKNPDSIQPTRQLLRYFEGHAGVPEIFDAQEKAHLADVKKVIQYAFAVLVILGALLYICANGDTKKIATWGTLLLTSLIVLSVIIPFDTLFTSFHRLLFPQGNWMFAPDSTLITFYPLNFFVSYGIAIAVNALIAAGTLMHIEIVSRRG